MRVVAPAAKRMASTSAVLPTPPCPTKPMLRILGISSAMPASPWSRSTDGRAPARRRTMWDGMLSHHSPRYQSAEGATSRRSRAFDAAGPLVRTEGARTRLRPLRRGPDDLVAENADALDLGFQAVAGLQEVARRGSHAVGSPGRDDVSRQEGRALRQDLDALRDGEHHLGRVALLAHLTVHAERDGEGLRVGNLVGGHEGRSHRAERVE